jgi:hypothetical protein
MIEKISVNKDDRDMWPLFFDYDLKNKKPRGYSGRLEFFSFGAINKMLLETNYIDNIVLVKLTNLIFNKGVFLVDYSVMLKNIKVFLEDILLMVTNRIIYMAESRSFNIEEYFKFEKKLLVKIFAFE